MTELSNAPENQSTDTEDEISLLDLLIFLVKHKLLILGLPFAVAVIVAGYSLTLPNIYTSSTKILLPQQNQSGAAAMAGLGSIAGLVLGGGARGATDIYIAMLKSRTVADNLIQRFGLMKPSDAKHPSAIRAKLAAVTSIVAGKEGVITVDVEDEDPKLATEIANAYVEELLKFTQVLAVTESSKRRLFFENQLAQARDNLAKAEAAARQALERGGLVNVDGQGRAMIEATARLRGQITVKEVQIGAMRTFAADLNPDLQLAQKELESMRRELAKSEGTGSAKAATNGATSPGMDSIFLLRNVKYYEVIFELLARQFEMSKIDEAKDSAVVQVMDKAVEPDLKSKPRRSFMVQASALVAGVVAVIIAIALEAAEKAKYDPRQAARLATLRAVLFSWRKTKPQG